MAHRALGLGVDFGTSNTAAGYMQGERPRLISFAPGQTTIPTTFFFDFDTRRMLIGEPANQALLAAIQAREVDPEDAFGYAIDKKPFARYVPEGTAILKADVTQGL